MDGRPSLMLCDFRTTRNTIPSSVVVGKVSVFELVNSSGAGTGGREGCTELDWNYPRHNASLNP